MHTDNTKKECVGNQEIRPQSEKETQAWEYSLVPPESPGQSLGEKSGLGWEVKCVGGAVVDIAQCQGGLG